MYVTDRKVNGSVENIMYRERERERDLLINIKLTGNHGSMTYWTLPFLVDNGLHTTFSTGLLHYFLFDPGAKWKRERESNMRFPPEGMNVDIYTTGCVHQTAYFRAMLYLM